MVRDFSFELFSKKFLRIIYWLENLGVGGTPNLRRFFGIQSPLYLPTLNNAFKNPLSGEKEKPDKKENSIGIIPQIEKK